MQYYLNDIDLATYGIVPGHAPGSNIALAGFLDMPARIGKTFHDWGDENGIEPYVETSEIMFGGRDLTFYGFIPGTNTVVSNYINTLQSAIDAFTDLVPLLCSLGTFSVYVKDFKVVSHNNVGAEIIIYFREPVVTLTGETLPSTGTSSYTIDDIPLTSFGLRISKTNDVLNNPELKEQYDTNYGSEGYQIVKRKNNTLELKGFIFSENSFGTVMDYVKKLYKLFSDSGTRTLILNSEIEVECFAADGFQITNIHTGDLLGSGIVSFSMRLHVISWSVIDYVLIGSQKWAKTNVSDNISGSRVYDDNEANRAIYGGLYSPDQFSAIEAAHPGWHIPTWSELHNLVTDLGGTSLAGGKIKSSSTLWVSPNVGSFDSGFNALPGGQWIDDPDVYYNAIGYFTVFYSKTADGGGSYFVLAIVNDSLEVYEYESLAFYSIRLVKDS